ncbi:hypothetical protein [Aporhodopirellula aestuarii]|uniref:Uncharacterized protein n=1 Tax=Aporhodopirellula aestuarii TaxID=2950107 RepID=A0ABT0TYV8_9BACT|nr:hypothetical protein [Aporhodopirellula aestuarii]MCM2369781.1 hypothetical protein [Aporhodopirellula aestuarii]
MPIRIRPSFTLALLLSASTSTSVFSQQNAAESLPREVAAAEAADISDWALAGVVWSDANLTRKLAGVAMRYAETEDQRASMRALAVESQRAVVALEAFGWGRVDQTNSGLTGTRDPAATRVGDRLEQFADQTTGTTQDSSPAVDTAPVAGIKRFDTESPAGAEDPGLDDERLPQQARVDIDQYRVDDYVDETPAERANLADAQEDAIEGAIAAASPDGIAGPASDRISKREGWTLSSSLPYSTDSIYDSDDYDHDVDYMVENRLGADSTNDASSDQGDADDDIDLDDPAEVITGEDEMANALARERLSDKPVSRSDGSLASSSGNRTIRVARPSDTIPQTRLQRYASVEDANAFDARWVQFRLDANQVRYSMTDPSLAAEAAQDALKQMQASAIVAGQSTDNEELKAILRPILELQLAD